jgi:hypothetical protein
MHDLGLGGPVEVERDPEAKHGGPCFDGVYGCHRCWDAENDGKGTLHTCEWCKNKDVHTRIVRASDEPVMYALCEPCRKRKADAEEQELAEFEPELFYGGGFEEDE